jgi:hypothetical protein
LQNDGSGSGSGFAVDSDKLRNSTLQRAMTAQQGALCALSAALRVQFISFDLQKIADEGSQLTHCTSALVLVFVPSYLVCLQQRETRSSVLVLDTGPVCVATVLQAPARSIHGQSLSLVQAGPNAVALHQVLFTRLNHQNCFEFQCISVRHNQTYTISACTLWLLSSVVHRAVALPE